MSCTHLVSGSLYGFIPKTILHVSKLWPGFSKKKKKKEITGDYSLWPSLSCVEEGKRS